LGTALAEAARLHHSRPGWVRRYLELQKIFPKHHLTYPPPSVEPLPPEIVELASTISPLRPKLGALRDAWHAALDLDLGPKVDWPLALNSPANPYLWKYLLLKS
jgi:hypothetical protein